MTFPWFGTESPIVWKFQDMGEIVRILSGGLAFSRVGGIARGIDGKQVQGEVAQKEEFGRSMSQPDCAGSILADGDVRRPVEVVFDAPIGTHRILDGRPSAGRELMP